MERRGEGSTLKDGVLVSDWSMKVAEKKDKLIN